MTPAEVCDEVAASGLRGRGGAGFPTGKKWRVAHDQARSQKYLICNADEGDPGAFMDRAVLESDPFRVVEGMLIAAYAIGATKGYVYCRAEYPLAIERLGEAIRQCRAAGLLGRNILGTLTDFDITIKMGAGAFVCGEETAILASIEGGRGMPRPRPPYPAVSGLHGCPTVLNNVETLANVPAVLDSGADWFQDLGYGDAAGTKVFALSGRVRNTGLVEVPVGIPLREVVYDIGGGAPAGHHIKAVQIGGPSGGCIPDEYLDVATDYGTLQELGAMMGSGGMVVMDERSCMVDVAKFFMEFIRNESCGKCTPCREGTTRMHEILSELTERPVGDDLRRLERFRGILHLEELAETVKETSLCGLGQSAANPVLSTLRFFRDEYEAHVLESACPAGACTGLRVFDIDPGAAAPAAPCAPRTARAARSSASASSPTPSSSTAAPAAAPAPTPAPSRPSWPWPERNDHEAHHQRQRDRGGARRDRAQGRAACRRRHPAPVLPGLGPEPGGLLPHVRRRGRGQPAAAHQLHARGDGGHGRAHPHAAGAQGAARDHGAAHREPPAGLPVLRARR